MRPDQFHAQLSGPLDKSAMGNTYVMVMVDHFKNIQELLSLAVKESRAATVGFSTGTPGRYGSCAEVIADHGTKFHGDFAALLEEFLTDHRTRSASHPQANAA